MQQAEAIHTNEKKTAGIYLHIPFCKQACVYCNFHFSTSLKYKDDVLNALLHEIEMQRDYLQDTRIATIYFGGGTPSILPVSDINRLIDAIHRFYHVDALQEVTLEANPDDLDKHYLQDLKHTAVNRFSIGVQSFRDEDLKYMKRAHNAQQADYAIKAAQDAGFDNLSIDLIYGTPGLSDTAWKHNLHMVKTLGVPHFSSYALTVEDKTALHHAIAQKKTAPVDAAQAAGQFEILMEENARMGYEHYEISNLAKPGHYAVHNTNYWRGHSYLGIGPSAHSFDGASRRRWNVANNAVYAKSILQEHKLPYEEERLTYTERLNEYIMTSLRTMWGCDLQRIALEWDNTCATLVEKGSHIFQEKKWVMQEDRKLFLTKEGKLFADRIAAELFISEDER